VSNSSPSIHESQIRDVAFGDDVTIVQPVNLYECIIGDGTFVGPFVEVQKGVQIGKRCKIQSHSFVCELVTIGNDCFISHGAMFINDRFEEGGPAGGDPSKWERTTIEDNVSIGTNATILPVHICSGTVIGAGSVVTTDIEEPGVFVGNPARRIRDL
jgi:acetyltransferase-like isoleucine patch superfamily enzyme